MTVDDPQVWTLIGVFAAVMLGGMTLMTSQLSRVIRAEVDRIDGTLSARIDRIDGTLSARIDGLDARLGRIETKVDDLDRELTNLATRFWRSQ
ncbi:hypothetical protein AB1285_16355 [Microbacterium sp. NRRL B-14842]|jgi:hypothetical protein|uniref:Uncharacterized protein n=1 Tax=Microbacterium paraoxydans TaxID=199592 RepID=A0ABZ2HY65_9MICO|nr:MULTISPECIES: hypothetical protein [Microbacterium]MCK2033040.1 hypothetical protein [Microbacterium sp. KSW4-4]MCT1364936.1 hypothetical protein [Microbacterium sp. p3-SID131]MCT1375880.1 hypothetical protein [Microbacterium sp. p3-SID337]MCT2225788.1 hypothetical protein [Microbacterium paraoxydans]